MQILEDTPNFADARKTLISFYSDQLSSQGTRLIGFVAGLFALLTLTSDVMRLNQLFSFPHIPFLTDWILSLSSETTDLLKLVFLFFAIAMIIYFILRTFFRYSFFGHMVTAVAHISEQEVRDKLLKLVDKNGKETEIKLNTFWALHLATSLDAYDYKRIFYLFPAKYFTSTGSGLKDYPNKANTGVIILIAFSFLFSFLFLLYLW